MTDRDNDLFGEDPEYEQMLKELERHENALYQRLSDYMDEEELDPAFVSRLLFELAIRLRTLSYGMDVEKPSATGLKVALDRCRRELDDLFRLHKKNADEYVSGIKEARVAAEAELDELDEDEEDQDAKA
jgi:hypothetical protein